MGIERFFTQPCTVEPFLGVTGYGVETFDTPVTVSCMVEDVRRTVTGKDGVDVTSNSTLYASINNAALFNTQARVTVNGVITRVIRTSRFATPGLNLPQHAVVSLQ